MAGVTDCTPVWFPGSPACGRFRGATTRPTKSGSRTTNTMSITGRSGWISTSWSAPSKPSLPPKVRIESRQKGEITVKRRPQRVLVAGAGGFIGGHLVKRLKAEGYWERGVDLKRHEY